MGARVARMFRNFNLENRVHREISRDKPRAAPRHPDTAASVPGSSEATGGLNEKNAPLLDHLRSLYVESTDPAELPQSSREEAEEAAESERRPLQYSVPLEQLGLMELTDVPKGKLTLAEALKALSSHQQQPQTWTAEKIAQHYSLELRDCKALLNFFCPFRVQIIPPTNAQTKRITDS
ncbi:NADH dehydrogenase [ubiquinone] 1 alpha subcomplex assembly factor 4 [Boleophthalmus pectinirostris]|uniref:NADH dehydrogenase [ubiquinone] 1 alpha subcomplex assembly factor 4 n=1 Tax=Boleophthalmus pectinirostris TaxID=150288 RepID=UPI000A1C42AF|nr:NADH dehydrogenase [ubiquinone] 1 alpha subcomplex assembly factor 4 [Boleophthalmus pectinirostris]